MPRVVGEETFAALYDRDDDGRIVDIKRPHYRVKTSAYMPVEFSAAAFRFGHSQVRGIYNLSAQVTDRPIFTSGPLQNPFQDLRGFRPLPQAWTLDWSLFFSVSGSTPQPSRLIDAKLTQGLFDLPDGGGSLAFRNLNRSQVLGLPSGQDVARAVKADILTGGDLGAPEPTPLWFYILKESELSGGRHLGPVGGRIVGEVLLGLVELDPASWFSQDPSWTPTVPAADSGRGFEMSDLIAFVGS